MTAYSSMSASGPSENSIVDAMAKNEILQIVIFSVFVGTIIVISAPQVKE